MRRMTIRASSWVIWSATVRASSARNRQCSGPHLDGIPKTFALLLGYDECIGAKKHLVTSPHIGSLSTGPPPGSKSCDAGENVQWWKRSSGDGVALSAGIISLVVGK